MLHKEKDLDVTNNYSLNVQLLLSYKWIYIVKSIRTDVAKAQVDFQENPLSKLKMAQNFLNGC